MNERLYTLQLQRDALLARIDTQRSQVVEIAPGWRNRLALVDQGMSVVRFVRARPLLIAGAAMVVVLRRRGVTGLLRSAWRLWKGFRLVAGYVHRM